MVEEIGMAKIEIEEGYVGNLTSDQEKALKQAWDKFFDCCEKATGNKSNSGGGGGEKKGGGGGGGGGDDKELNPKDAGIPKGDDAKEEAKKQEEEKAMRELQTEYGSDALRTTFWRLVKFDDPDAIMLRFLRARKWDVSRAIAMLAGCLKWRLDNNVELLAERGDLNNGDAIEKFLEQQRSGKVYAQGADLKECPICWVNVAKHFTRGQPTRSMEEFVIFAMESFRLLMVPPNGKVVIFFNMNGFGLSNMDWNCILYLVKCLEAYYPESLAVMYIHCAPWIFSGIWKILGPLLDPVVRSKVQFTKTPKDTSDRVPAERFPTEFKGSLAEKPEWIEPAKGENDMEESKEARQKRYDAYFELAEEYEDITRSWTKKADDKTTEKRKLLTKKLRVAQFEMEPYYRGRTLMHRDGTIDGQGIVTWLYVQENGDKIRHTVGRKDCVATLKREIKEVEDGSSLADAQKKSDDALAKSDWVTLYGDEETARRIEGPRVDGEVPEAGFVSTQSKITGGLSPDKGGLEPAEAEKVIEGKAEPPSSGGGAKGDSGKKAGAAAAGGAAAGGAAAAAASSRDSEPSNEAFADAPEAPKKHLDKAVDGDKKVDDKADTAEGGGAAETPVQEKSNGMAAAGGAGGAGAASNGSKSNGGGAMSTLKEKTASAKASALDKVKSNGSSGKENGATDYKGDANGDAAGNGKGGMGRRFSKLFRPAMA